ncbi:MAG: N-acetyl-gamma-glutamyl-phosphate reductase [Deltaproteobacteria bacterium]|nr:N-acetyl-gamma-glutamyl-phosphate reductase [Deltaproteobacteria bacterium]
MIKVAILGGSGYTGLELLRILAGHPEARVVEVTSRQYKGASVAGTFPWLRGFYDHLVFSGPEDFKKIKADCVFSALPHGASLEAVPAVLKTGAKVIDLSADFRLRDAKVYEKWYGKPAATSLLKRAVYGLPELYRGMVKKADLIANPGCYPTGALLALAPLAKKGLIDIAPGSVIIDSKSGVSGAGRQASIETSFAEVAGSFKAYKVGSHRHTPEIDQELSAAAGGAVAVTFTPHLLPVSRGILTTAYARLKKGAAAGDMHKLYEGFYSKEPFVRVMPEGQSPDISLVRGSNFCDIGLWPDEKKGMVTAVSAIDNLVKGAAGQAVQNMNIVFGLDEETALKTPPVAI